MYNTPRSIPSIENKFEKKKRKKTNLGQAWWHMALILALGRQRQVDLCEFKGSLDYIASSRTAGATGRPCLKKTKNKTKQKHKKPNSHTF